MHFRGNQMLGFQLKIDGSAEAIFGPRVALKLTDPIIRCGVCGGAQHVKAFPTQGDRIYRCDRFLSCSGPR